MRTLCLIACCLALAANAVSASAAADTIPGIAVVALRGEVIGWDFDKVADEVPRRAKTIREKVVRAEHP